MKPLIVASLIVTFALAAFGQTAKVIALSPHDAAQAKQLHQALAKAKDDVETFDRTMKYKYTETNESDQGGIHVVLKDGWSSGFEYSEDWMFIVPKVNAQLSQGSTWWNGSCLTVNPAINTTPSTGTGMNLTLTPSISSLTAINADKF